MIEKILYLSDTVLEVKDGISVVICKTREVALFYKDICFAKDIAVLIENDTLCYEDLGLDGVYFSEDITMEDFKLARKNYPDAEIGKDCLVSKHSAMLVGEAGGDFVLFSGAENIVTELTNWWAEIMELPVVAKGCKIPPKKADFVMV